MELGLDPAGLRTGTTRTWHPMDGVAPPGCPFVEQTTHHVGLPGGPRLALLVEAAHWNQDEIARLTVRLSMEGHTGEGDFQLAVWSAAGGRPDDIEGWSATGAVPERVARPFRSP